MFHNSKEFFDSRIAGAIFSCWGKREKPLKTKHIPRVCACTTFDCALQDCKSLIGPLGGLRPKCAFNFKVSEPDEAEYFCEHPA